MIGFNLYGFQSCLVSAYSELSPDISRIQTYEHGAQFYRLHEDIAKSVECLILLTTDFLTFSIYVQVTARLTQTTLDTYILIQRSKVYLKSNNSVS